MDSNIPTSPKIKIKIEMNKNKINLEKDIDLFTNQDDFDP